MGSEETVERLGESGPRRDARARSRRPLTRQRRIRRRRLTAALLVLALAAAGTAILVGMFGRSDAGPGSLSPVRSPVTLRLGGHPLSTIPADEVQRVARGAAPLPVGSTEVIQSGRARITYRVDTAGLQRRLAASSSRTVTVPAEPVASRVTAPIVQQAFPRNCEAASLSMLLATVRPMIDQRTLQRQLPEAQPVAPQGGPGGEVWGDPEQGFVGRPTGGGSAGGYGVYERPVIGLASRYGSPVDLTGQPVGAIYARLLSGHAVMAWIGLSNGPYATWHTPQGQLVRANFGEHAVLLTGVIGNRVLVNDPLDGRRKAWSKALFHEMWNRLGTRAISI